MKRSTIWIAMIAIIIAGIALYAYSQNNKQYYDNATQPANYSNPGNAEKTAQEISNDLGIKERSNPTFYFHIENIDNHFNLIDEAILKGIIVCDSKVARFKDVILEASYYTESSTLLGTEQFPRYEVWGPGSRVSYKFKGNAPNHTKRINIRIVNATPVQ